MANVIDFSSYYRFYILYPGGVSNLFLRFKAFSIFFSLNLPFGFYLHFTVWFLFMCLDWLELGEVNLVLNLTQVANQMGISDEVDWLQGGMHLNYCLSVNFLDFEILFIVFFSIDLLLRRTIVCEFFLHLIIVGEYK